MIYHIPAGTPVKIAGPGETARDHILEWDKRYDGEDLVANPDTPPTGQSAPALWARRGWYVFRRMDPAPQYLLVQSFNVEIEF